MKKHIKNMKSSVDTQSLLKCPISLDFHLFLELLGIPDFFICPVVPGIMIFQDVWAPPKFLNVPF